MVTLKRKPKPKPKKTKAKRKPKAKKPYIPPAPKPVTSTTTTTTPAGGPAGGGDTSTTGPASATPASAVVATPDNTGTDTTADQGDSGDLTGTSALVSDAAVFSQGSGYAPNYHYDTVTQQQAVTAQNMIADQQGGQ